MMEWLVFFGVVCWLTATAALWLRLCALERQLTELREGSGRPGPEEPKPVEGSSAGEPTAAALPRGWSGAAPAVPSVGLNFSRRVQVLRLHRRGESVSHIAAALGLSSAETELMIKLHATGLTSVAQGIEER